MPIAAPVTFPISAGPDVVAGATPPRTPSGSHGVASPLGVDPERLLLDAAALRRRQLCAAFLHGSARSWRVRRRIWPAAVAGLLIVALVIGALAVAAAFARQQELEHGQRSLGVGTAIAAAAQLG